jgi:hypothetical protein
VRRRHKREPLAKKEISKLIGSKGNFTIAINNMFMHYVLYSIKVLTHDKQGHKLILII